MAWEQADLDKLDAALAAGGAIQRLKFRDQEFEFRSIDDMLKLRALMAQSLSVSSSDPKNYRLAATSKGV